MNFTTLRISKNEMTNAAAGSPTVIHGMDLPDKSSESAGACCQTRKAIQPLSPRTTTLIIAFMTPRSSMKLAQIAKTIRAALPRLIWGMESGDMGRWADVAWTGKRAM